MCEPLSVYICHHSMVPTAQAGCMGGLILHAEQDLVGDDFRAVNTPEYGLNHNVLLTFKVTN